MLYNYSYIYNYKFLFQMIKFIKALPTKLLQLYFDQYLTDFEPNDLETFLHPDDICPTVYWHMKHKSQSCEGLENIRYGNVIASKILISNEVLKRIVLYFSNREIKMNFKLIDSLKFNTFKRTSFLLNIHVNRINANEKWRSKNIKLNQITKFEKGHKNEVIQKLNLNRLLFNPTLGEAVKPLPQVIRLAYTEAICELLTSAVVGFLVSLIYQVLNSVSAEGIAFMYNNNNLRMICDEIRRLLKTNDLTEEERKLLRALLKKLLKILGLFISLLIVVILLYKNKETLINFICFIFDTVINLNENNQSDDMKHFYNKLLATEKIKENLNEDFLGKIWQIQAEVQKQNLIGDLSD